MTKFRPATTTEAAVHRCIGILGLEDAAVVADAQPSTIYAFGDPDKERRISFDAAAALTVACHRETNGREAPFYDLLRLMLEGQTLDMSGLDVTAALLDIHEAAGQLSALVRGAQAAASPGGAAFTASEKAQINTVALAVIAEVQMVLNGVNGGDEHGGRIRGCDVRFVNPIYRTKKADGEAA